MAIFRMDFCCVLLACAIWIANGDSTFAGSSVSSDSSGTRSVLITGRNGVVQTRIGGGSGVAAVGSRTGSVGTYASAGGASAYAGPGGAYAGPGGAYAGSGGLYPGPWGFPYWNGGGSYASAGGSSYPYNYPPYPYDPYAYGGDYRRDGTAVYSGTDSNGIQTRFANIAPGGQATIVEQNGDEDPKVYTYRGATTSINTDKIDA